MDTTPSLSHPWMDGRSQFFVASEALQVYGSQDGCLVWGGAGNRVEALVCPLVLAEVEMAGAEDLEGHGS